MKRMISVAILGGALLTMAAQIASAQTPATSGTAWRRMSGGTGRSNAQDRTFATMAAQGNLAEVAAGRLAKAKTQHPDVQMVAETLVREHGQAYNDLRRIARDMNAPLPAQPDAMHRKMAMQMARMSGASFDKAFIKGQIKDHHKTIALFEKQMARGANPKLRAYAQKYLPGIKDHTRMIYQAANALNIPNPGGNGSGPQAKL